LRGCSLRRLPGLDGLLLPLVRGEVGAPGDDPEQPSHHQDRNDYFHVRPFLASRPEPPLATLTHQSQLRPNVELRDIEAEFVDGANQHDDVVGDHLAQSRALVRYGTLRTGCSYAHLREKRRWRVIVNFCGHGNKRVWPHGIDYEDYPRWTFGGTK